MNLIFNHDESVAKWVGDKLGKPFSDPYVAFGTVNQEGRLTGGAVFNSYTGDSIELSIAGSGMISRSLWRAIAHYVFEQLKCSRLQIHTSVKNKKIKRMANRFGFVFEGKARQMFGKYDGLCYSITTRDLPDIQRRWKL